jgi:hypothetical protein
MTNIELPQQVSNRIISTEGKDSPVQLLGSCDKTDMEFVESALRSFDSNNTENQAEHICNCREGPYSLGMAEKGLL